MVNRTYKDRIIDRFLALYILQNASKEEPEIGRTKIQKIVFLAELRMILKRMKGLNYSYIKLLHGPYSQQLANDVNLFSKLGFIASRSLRLTKTGTEMVEAFPTILRDNKKFFNIVDKEIENCTSTNLESLLDWVYSMRHPMGKNITIGETPLRTPIINPISKVRTEIVFKVSQNNLEDLALSLDPLFVRGLKEGIDDIKNGRLLTHEEVFGTV